MPGCPPPSAGQLIWPEPNLKGCSPQSSLSRERRPGLLKCNPGGFQPRLGAAGQASRQKAGCQRGLAQPMLHAKRSVGKARYVLVITVPARRHLRHPEQKRQPRASTCRPGLHRRPASMMTFSVLPSVGVFKATPCCYPVWASPGPR